MVDFELDAAGHLKWVIEFQCIEAEGHIYFYSATSHPNKATIDSFLRRAREAGLGVYLDSGLGTKRVDHTDFSYDAPKMAQK